MLRSVSTMHVLNTMREAQTRREVPLSPATHQVDAAGVAVVHNVVEMLLGLGFVIAKDLPDDSHSDRFTELDVEKWDKASAQSRAVIAEIGRAVDRDRPQQPGGDRAQA